MDFLDGLRGLAALYVVLHHAYVEVNYRYDGTGLSPKALFLTNWLLHGHASVGIFIVLSGYCPMPPVAQSPTSVLRGGFQGCIQRRARRILPPYYVALGLFLTLIAGLSRVPHPIDPRWNVSDHDVGPGVLLSHLLLIHYLREAWIFRIDPPMWSVATEWQIFLRVCAAAGRRFVYGGRADGAHDVVPVSSGLRARLYAGARAHQAGDRTRRSSIARAVVVRKTSGQPLVNG